MSTDPMTDANPLINQESLAAAEGMRAPAQPSAADEPPAAGASTAEASTATAEGSSATAEATTAEATTAEATTAEATAAEATSADATASEATTTDGSVAAAIAAAAVPVAAPATESRVRARLVVAGRRVLRFAFALSLFALGVLAGLDVFLRNQPVVTPVGDPAINGVSAPPVVAELAAAINRDDADAIRSALAPEIFGSYTAEMESRGIVSVDGVETLGTYADGPRSATALVVLGRTADGNAFAINLVVLTQDGTIVRLR